MTWPGIKFTSSPSHISPTSLLITLVTDVVTIITKIVGTGQGEKRKTMGNLEEVEGRILEERSGRSEGGRNHILGRNHTFGGFGFDICNPNTCLGGDTLTVNMMIDIKVQSIKL